MQPVKRRAGVWPTLLALLCAALLQAADPLPLQVLRNATFDQFQRIEPRLYRPTVPVKIIDIDDASIKKLGQWPWPRTRIAELIARLRSAAPKVIAFDILFTEADRTSPQQMLKLWPLPPKLQHDLRQLPDHDRVLADTIKDNHVVLGFASSALAGDDAPLNTRARFIEIGNAAGKNFLPRIDGVLAPLPLLAESAAGNGALSFIPDADGVIRKIPLCLQYRGGILPSLTAEALRIAERTQNIALVADSESNAGISTIRIGKIAVPTTANGEIWLHYSQPETARYIPAWKILTGDMPAEALHDAILLVGASAQGLMDLRFSALGSIIPGIEIHAQALEQMLTGHYLLRPAWSGAMELVILIALGLALGWITLNAGALRSFSLFAVTIAALWLCSWQAYAHERLLIDPMLPGIGLLWVYLTAGICRHLYSEQRQRWVKEAFARYISPNRVEHLLAHPDALELGGKRQICSFVFSDLANFTSLMENMDPGAAVSLLNRYLDDMIAIAFAHHGTLDRIVGDAVAIMFSAPIEQPDHQRRALQCALAMQRFAERYSRELNERNIPFGRTRIGVHTGEVIVGNFGGNTIFDYRALGDPVNTASRLEGANKYVGTSICVSEATLAGCDGIPARPIGRLRVKGKSIPLQVYQPVPEDANQLAPLKDYQSAYCLLTSDPESALIAFRRLNAGFPNDTLVAFHVQRLQNQQSGDLIELSGK